jgi:GTPase SAR1 family protein
MADSTGTGTAATPATPAAAPTLGADALHIVLFGLPAAGKSSLLGALAQAGQTQQYALNGRLTDLSGGLSELQHRLYEGQPRSTREEVVPYPVEFEAFAQDAHGQPANDKLKLVLIDCDGQVANDLLSRRRSLQADSRDGTLAAEVCAADTLILVVDASSSAPQIDEEFTVFGRFLRLFEQNRGQRSEVGGLPVFLVLTKCDLLVKPNDTAVDWYERIEERKRNVHRRFQEFVARQSREGPLPFGRIDLHLWATAVMRPTLAGQQPRPLKQAEPYGVAELFRQTVDSARQYGQRRQHSTRRLLWTAAGAAGFFAVLLALTGVLLWNRPRPTPIPVADLERTVVIYRDREGPTPSARLSGDIRGNIRELRDVKNNPNFGQVREDLRQFVEKRLKELEAYSTFSDAVDKAAGEVRTATTEDRLQADEEKLATLQPPPEYAEQWQQTEAVQGRAEALKDIKALRQGIDVLEEWYKGLARDGKALTQFNATGPVKPDGTWPSWYGQVKDLSQKAGQSPYGDRVSLPDSRLTYGNVQGFARVTEARDEWKRVRDLLKRVGDLAAVLGIAGTLPDQRPLLVIPRPPAFVLNQVPGRLDDLKASYPDYKKEFFLEGLPEAFAAGVRQAAQTNYDNLLVPAQEVVLRRWRQQNPEGKDTFASWRRLQPWLSNPEELSEWRELARVLGQLTSPTWVDPVAELYAFLDKDHFTLDLKRLTLVLPEAVAGKFRIRSIGPLQVYHSSPDKNPSGPELLLKPIGTQWQRDEARKAQTWTLRSESNKVLTYQPGDNLWAEMTVDTGKEGKWQLTWARGSSVWQFECLSKPPRLHPADQPNTKGDLVEGLTLEVTEGSALPTVPALLPVVKP